MISSPFGWRVHPIFGGVRMHTGTDIAAPAGTPVVATYSGRVTVADFVGGYGLTVVLRHDDRTIETIYGHLSEIFVRPGDTIQQGEVIGRVGSTGNSTGPHLHFELRKPTANGWVAVNSGDLLHDALGLVQNGLQLASVEDGQPSDTLLALNVPEFLLSGKDATKDAP
jgi:murein DD-endopeptidase MepM/ murein hydrolase activator NlpD